MSELFEKRALPVSFPQVEPLLKTLHSEWDPRLRYYESPTKYFLFSFSEYLKTFVEIDDLSSYSPLPSQGTTGAFHTFYLINAHKELLLLPGEYPYHEQVFRKLGTSVRYWNLEKPSKESYLILSQPFSGDGNVLENYDHIIQLCELWNIDILLDLSFFALTNKKIQIKKSAKIKAISFSLSKMFDVGNFRLGITYWNTHFEVPESILREWTYENHFSSYLATSLLQKLPILQLRTEAQKIQTSLCSQFNLTPSDSYLFGLSEDPKWSSFFRKNGIARICLSKLISRNLLNTLDPK
ncbi:hypothetical protein K2X05_00650 [bacterium]|nr:hypothetical protein [bacterium]